MSRYANFGGEPAGLVFSIQCPMTPFRVEEKQMSSRHHIDERGNGILEKRLVNSKQKKGTVSVKV